MLGAIAGDIIGSIYEGGRADRVDFELFGALCQFTDDTVCTVAVADSLCRGDDIGSSLRRWFHAHPDRGFGGFFRQWAMGLRDDYESWGNGSAMRISPVGHWARSLDEARELARWASEPTHGHPDAVAGAEAVAVSMVMARDGADAAAIRNHLQSTYGYDLSRSISEIRPDHGFDVSCRGTVPVAVTCALEADSVETAIRSSCWLGGDSDTIACIAGGLAEMRFGLPETLVEATLAHLTPDVSAVLTVFGEARSDRHTDTAPD